MKTYLKPSSSLFIRLLLCPALLAAVACGPDGSTTETAAASTAAEVADLQAPLQSPGTLLMARRLELLLDNTSPRAQPFRNQERLDMLRTRQPPEDAAGRLRSELVLAQEALRAGESRIAAQGLTDVIAGIERLQPSWAEAILRLARRDLAIAHLRIGEQENCVGHLGQEQGSRACLMPIGEAGVHRQTAGSQAALEVLAGLLEADPDDLLHRWLFNIAAMTLGKYPAQVPEAWRLPPEIFASDHPMDPFVDIAPRLGLATLGLAGGSVVEDLNGDGYLDVMVSSWGERDPLRVFLAQSDAGSDELQFIDFTSRSGLRGLTGGLNLVPADYDNDGDVDILVLRGAWLGKQGRQPNSLLRNNGGAFFEDVTEEVGLLSFHPTQTAAWGDVDNDGWLDLYIGNESTPRDPHPGQLYLSSGPVDGGPTFVDVAPTAGVTADGFVKGVALGDVDNDGWLDLYVSKIGGDNQLFRNLGIDDGGAVRFEERGRAAGVQEPVDSFPTWFFDYDNDGWLDLFVGDYATDFVGAWVTPTVADYLGQAVEGTTSRLFRNRGDGTFDDVSAAVGLDRPLLAMGANYGDIDNDGWPDIYIGTGAPDFSALVPNRLFRNGEGRIFQDVTTAAAVGHLQKGHGVSFADIDHDGDQDILAVLGGAFSGDIYQNALFANPGNDQRWVTLTLEGREANRSALGARLRLQVETADGRREIYATVSSGGSFGASPFRQEIGLGAATALLRVEVRWPGGDVGLYEDLPMEQHLHLRQGATTAESLPFKPMTLR